MLVAVLLALAQEHATPTAEPPDVAIYASATASQMQFDDEPIVNIRVHGSVNGRPAAVVSHTSRENLPERVTPRVIYRDIGVRLTITSTLPEIEKIIDDALAEPARSSPPPFPDSQN